MEPEGQAPQQRASLPGVTPTSPHRHGLLAPLPDIHPILSVSAPLPMEFRKTGEGQLPDPQLPFKVTAKGGAVADVGPATTPGKRPSSVSVSRTSVSGASEGSGMSSSDYSSLTYTGKGSWAASENPCIQFLDSHLRTPMWYRKLRPRYRQMLFLLISEIVIILALLAQFTAFRSAMHNLLLDQVQNEVQLMDMTYGRKNDEIALLAKGWSQNTHVLSFLKGEANATAAKVSSTMAYDANYITVECAMLLDTNANIIIDINRNNTGKHFDPAGVVTRVLNTPNLGKLQVAHLVPFEELQRMEAPVYRQSYSSMADQDVTHPFDTKESSLMRYVVTPIFEHVNGTGKVLGAFLTGDITNGKTPITYLPTRAFGRGFSGLYTLKSDGSYIRSSSSVFVPDCTPHVDQLITQTFDPMTPAIQHKLLKKAAANPGRVVKLMDGEYAWAAQTAPYGVRNTTSLPNEIPPAVMVRALNLRNDHTFTDLLSRTWYLFAFMLLINILSVYFSSSTFIAPLEELAASLKAKQQSGLGGQGKITVNSLGNLDLFAKYLLRVFITLVTAIVCSVIIANQIGQSMAGVVKELTLSELGIADVSYNIAIDQISQGVRSMSMMPELRMLAANPNDTALQNATRTIIHREKEARKLEFFAMQDRNSIVISAINPKRLGTHSDPAGISSLTIHNNVRYKITGKMDYETFLIPGVPDSALSPYNTHDDALIRWASAPVYAPTNTYKHEPDAVLIAGTLVNGKTAVCERMLLVTGVGYVAYFIANGHGGYSMVSSAYIERGTKAKFADIKVSDEVVRASAAKGGEPAIVWGTVRGKRFALAAMRNPPDRYASSYGQIDIKNVPESFVVYGKDRETTKGMEDGQMAWIVCMAILQITMMMLLNYAAYVPFRKLMLVLEDKGFTTKSSRPTVGKVIKVYIIDYTRACIADLRSRPLHQSFKMYIIDRSVHEVRRGCRRLRNCIKHPGGRKRRSKVKPEPPVATRFRTTSGSSPGDTRRSTSQQHAPSDPRRGSGASTGSTVPFNV